MEIVTVEAVWVLRVVVVAALVKLVIVLLLKLWMFITTSLGNRTVVVAIYVAVVVVVVLHRFARGGCFSLRKRSRMLIQLRMNKAILFSGPPASTLRQACFLPQYFLSIS